MVNDVIWKSDLPRIHHIVQNTMTYNIKSLVLGMLKDYFRHDSFYKYNSDPWGFNLTPDHTDMPLEAGIADNSTTRVCIQESFRMEADFFPAIIVRSGGITSVPISFNREATSVQWDNMIFTDGYGNIATFKTPKYFIFAGAWEGSINIDVLARDPRTRDDLIDLISILFTDIAHNELLREGLVITGVSTAGSSDVEDRTQRIHKDTVSLKTRSEWRRLIPITNLIEIVHFAVEFGTVPDGIPAHNLSIETEMTLIEVLAKL